MASKNARPCDVAWIRSIVDQCKAASVPCFVKQLGSRATMWNEFEKRHAPLFLDGKGNAPADWPEVFPREFPTEARQ